MKKLLVVVVMFLVVLSSFEPNANFSLLNYFSGDYTVYTSKRTGKDSIDLGFCYMSTKPVSDYVVGESIVIENLEVASALDKLNAIVVKTEYLEDGTVLIYAHTSLIEDVVKMSGKRVNLQIATNDQHSIIGWPLILGSY